MDVGTGVAVGTAVGVDVEVKVGETLGVGEPLGEGEGVNCANAKVARMLRINNAAMNMRAFFIITLFFVL